MDKIETNFLDTQECKLLVWFRYMDVFFIWTHGKEKLEQFLKRFQQLPPNFKFTHEFNKESIPLLNINVSLPGGQLTTDRHIKSNDKHHYLHYTSAHPDHINRFIFFNKTDFERYLDDMKSWFQARSYPKHLPRKEMGKVRFNKENSNTKQSKSKGV